MQHKNAQYCLADCYYNGEGVKRNCQQATYWYEKAAEQGDPDAITMLQKMPKDK